MWPLDSEAPPYPLIVLNCSRLESRMAREDPPALYG